ncbi:653_t:CDS:2, partial [Dentiscutata erythropus]
ALYGELCANLLFSCQICSKEKISPIWCQECSVKYLVNNFNNWTSGDQVIDNAIKDIQTKSKIPIDFVEWIPYEQLEKGGEIGSGGFGNIYNAFWKQGPISMHGGEFKRTRGIKVALKRLKSDSFLNDDIENYKNELCMHINCCTNLNIYTTGAEFKTGRSPILRCYGLTKDNEGYMLEFKTADKVQNIQKIQNNSPKFPDNISPEFPDNTNPEFSDKQNCIENNTNSKLTTDQFQDSTCMDLEVE